MLALHEHVAKCMLMLGQMSVNANDDIELAEAMTAVLTRYGQHWTTG